MYSSEWASQALLNTSTIAEERESIPSLVPRSCTPLSAGKSCMTCTRNSVSESDLGFKVRPWILSTASREY